MLPIFWAAVMILNRFMLEPVIATVERRKAASSGTSEGAAHLQAEAEKLLNDHSAAIRKGGDEAAAAREKVIAATRSEVEGTLAQARLAAEKSVTEARTVIRAESDTARTQLKAEVEKIAGEMARKLLGRAA